MDRKEIYDKITDYLSAYKPERIGIFGSFSRGEETTDSDVDVLVSFKKPFGLLLLVKIERELSEIIGRKVDLVSERSLKNKKMKSYILQDMKIIYE